jgi:hypothetical protein
MINQEFESCPLRQPDHLSTIESLRVFSRSFGFYAPNSKGRHESIGCKPIPVPLTPKGVHHEVNFLLANLFIQMNKEIRGTEVAVVFYDFIFKDEMVSESIPGKFRDQPVILVQIMTIMSKNNVRGDSLF